jgi:hypothetical protein
MMVFLRNNMNWVQLAQDKCQLRDPVIEVKFPIA